MAALLVNAVGSPVDEDMLFVLDYPFPGSIVSEDEVNFIGWCLHRSDRAERITFENGDELVEETELSVHRANVAQRYSEFPGSQHAGFQRRLRIASTDMLSVMAILESGRRQKLLSLSFSRIGSSTERILFMHVPKTAGTSVGRFIESHFDNVEVGEHLESNPQWWRSPSDFASSKR